MTTLKRQREIYNRTSDLLNDNTIDDLLEKFDITPEDCILLLYDAGMIDPEQYSKILGVSLEYLEGSEGSDGDE